MILLAAAYLLSSTGPLLDVLRKGGARAVVLGPPPSPNRKENPYQGTINFQGLRIFVENAKGSTRRGVDPQGKPWATRMTAHYGEFSGTLGVDGDPVDVFVGDDADAPMAYVVHRKWPGTEVYDEDKVILGVRSAAEAEALFRANYNRPGNLGGVTAWPLEELRDYLAHPAHEGKRLDQPARVRLLLRKAVPKGTTMAHRAGLVLAPGRDGARRWRRLAPAEHAKDAEVANHIDELDELFLDDQRTMQIASRAGWKFHVRPSRYHAGHHVMDIGKHPKEDNDPHTVSVDPVRKVVTVRKGWETSPHAGAILRRLAGGKHVPGYDVEQENPAGWGEGNGVWGNMRREREPTPLGKFPEVAGKVRDVTMTTPERRDGRSGYKLQRHHVQVAKTPDEVEWYHATRASSVPSIMQHGLVPGKRKQGEGWTELNLALQRANYLTHDPDYARRIAETLADRFGEKAVVLKVSGKALSDPRKIVIDEDTLRTEYGITGHEGTGARVPAFYQSMHDTIASVGYRDRIDPKHITTHAEYEPPVEEMEKGEPIKNRPGLHLDPEKHRWTRVQMEIREPLRAMNDQHHAEHAAELVRQIKAQPGAPNGVRAWQKPGTGAWRVYLPGNAGYIGVSPDGSLNTTERGRRVYEPDALYPAWRKAVTLGRAEYIDALGDRLDKHAQERVKLHEGKYRELYGEEPPPVEEMAKGESLAHRPGLHLDPSKHRWVRDADITPGATFPSPLGDLTVHHANEHEAVVRPASGGAPVAMPRASAPHFFNDLAGSLAGHTPTSGNPHVDGVIRENGEWLGKGNDGIVFGHGDHVVKVSTTVPYQPFNPGHRTPEEAAEHLRLEAHAHQRLQGIPHVPAVSAHEHEGRTWLVKPHLNEVGQLSPGEAGSVRDAVRAMHARGWVLGDTVQLGRDHKGDVQFMDLGQAHPMKGDHERERDEERLEELYREHGHAYYPVGDQLRRAEGARRMMVNAALKRGDLARAEHYHGEWKEHARRRGAELATGDDFDAWMKHEDAVDDINRRMQALRTSAAAPLAKGVRLYSLLKATIRTPMGADGRVDYEAVPVGASIWVRVTDPHSPLHGRPILLTKRPDHQFALTGGSAAKHIEARRHLVVSSGRARASAADEAGLAARQEAEARNAPLRARQKELRKQARAEQGAAEDKFMAALGITRRGLTKEEKARVHEAARAHAEASGLTGRDAESFAKHMADGIARREREYRMRQAAHRLELARHIAAGRDADEAATLAGPAPSPVEYTAPAVDPSTWSEMSEPERQAAVLGDLEQQDTARTLAEMEGSRFEEEPQAEPQDEPAPPTEPTLTPTPAAHEPQDDTLPTDAEGEPAPGFGAEPAAEHVGTPTDPDPSLGAAEDFANGEHPSNPPESPPPAGPTFTVGKEDEQEAAPVPADPATPPTPAGPARPPSAPILSPEKAREALEHFRAYAAARKTEKEVAGGLEKLPATESAMPTSVEDLRLRLGGVDDDELNRFLDEYQRQNGAPPDTSFYSAMSPHWNDDVGNKLAGAVTRGAASAITGIVGEELGARFDVQRLVDALGPEAAAMAVVHRLREELPGERFGAFVEKLRDANATGQKATETRAMQRHHELLKQAEDLERQVRAGDLTSQASVEVLRARNLVEQRENLGTALGSLQASAALYHFADQAKGERFRKQDVVINVGSKVALADKLKRLGPVKATTVYHPTLGYQVHTTTEALRKYVGRTEADKADADRWRAVKYDTAGIEHDAEGREWVPGYRVPGFRSHFGEPESLPPDQRHLAGQPIRFLADQRNNIEWLHGSGGGLVTMRTGGGKTVTSVGVAAKMLHENPRGRHLRIVPDGREEQWASEIRNFTSIPVTVLPAASTKDERARILANAPEGSVVVVGHTNAGRYDHEALASTHAWDSIGIDEPQELRAKSGSGKLGAGAKRIMRIPAKNRHALTATPATDHPVEAFDIVNWARPRALGFRTRFERAFSGFGGGTNAQDAALERALYREMEPHVSGERMVAPHYAVEHSDQRVRMSPSQLAKQREIESRVDATIQAAVEEAKAKKQAGERGYAERSYAALYRDAREKAMSKLEAEHRANLSGGDTSHNPKLSTMQKVIGSAAPSERHVIFVDSADQRRAVTSMLEGMGHKGKVKNITASAKGDTVKRGGVEVSAIEERKRDWKATPGGFIVIDRSSASGHNLAEGDHLHVLGNPDDAAQMLQAHGRLGRANREGDFSVHTYRYDDSPFEHARWNRLDRQLKVLRATAPGMFVEGKRREPEAALAKGASWGVRLRRWIARA